MSKMRVADRLLLLLAAHLAGYQVVVGVDRMAKLPMLVYTIAFGVILVAALMLIILGYEALQSPWVVILAALIPLGLSSGLVAQYLPGGLTGFAVFALAGLAGILLTRLSFPGRVALLWLALVHGVAGLVIILLPILLVTRGATGAGSLLISLGGALISGVGLALLRVNASAGSVSVGHPLWRFFAPAYTLTSLALVLGFWLA
jgi:hypothetical protein